MGTDFSMSPTNRLFGNSLLQSGAGEVHFAPKLFSSSNKMQLADLLSLSRRDK